MAPWLRAPTSSKLRRGDRLRGRRGHFHAGRLGHRANCARARHLAGCRLLRRAGPERAPPARHAPRLRGGRAHSTIARRRSTTPMSSQIFEAAYLEALDGNKSYLLASDIAEFEPLLVTSSTTRSRRPTPGPAFQIFTRFQQRNREVLHLRAACLDTEPDFTLDESFRFDRTDAGLAGVVGRAPRALAQATSRTTPCHSSLAGKTWPECARRAYASAMSASASASSRSPPDDVFETFMNAYSHASTDPAFQLHLCRRAIPRIQHRDEPSTTRASAPRCSSSTTTSRS